MALAFPPKVDDIRLLRSPLAEVVCQIRFPSILSIPTNSPVTFQEKIRRRFPEFETEDSVVFQVNASSGSPLPTANQQTINRAYKFFSRQRGSSVTLAQDFFALSTTKYAVWEEFASDLLLVSEAVREIYEPSHATRIGLRYVNILEPEKLGLSSLQEVVKLLQPVLTSMFVASVWTEPAEMVTQLVLNDDEGRLGFRMGKRVVDDRPVWQLDFDYFEEDVNGLPLENLIERCERYHTVIYDAFRWSIVDDRIDVFGPVLKQERLE